MFKQIVLLGKKVGQKTSILVDIIMGGLLTFIIAITIFQVFNRYIFHLAAQWSEELNRFLFIWMIMFATIKADHMKIGFFLNKSSFKLQRFFLLIQIAIIVTVIGFLTVGTLKMIAITKNDYYTGIHLNVRWVYVAVFVPILLWTPLIIVKIINTFREIRAK